MTIQRVYTNVTFEELLLKMIKPGKLSLTTKRKKIATGAEVITHDHVYERYQKMEAEKKEKLKKQEEKKANKEKKKPREKRASTNNNTGAEKRNREKRCENGGNYKQTDIQVSGVDMSLPGPSGLNKKRKIKSESKKSKTINSTKKIVRRNKKLTKISSSSSTSISDCMSVHEDSDILDVTDEEYDITRDLYTNELKQNYESCNEQDDKIFSKDKKSNVVKKVGENLDKQNKETVKFTEESDETNMVTGEFNGEWDGVTEVEKEEYCAFNDQAVTEGNKVLHEVSGISDERNDAVEKVCDSSDERYQVAKDVGERSHQRNKNTTAKKGNDKWDVKKNIEEKENYKKK